jgi:hypothetical protein
MSLDFYHSDGNAVGEFFWETRVGETSYGILLRLFHRVLFSLLKKSNKFNFDQIILIFMVHK